MGTSIFLPDGSIKEGILFLDELNTAAPMVQASAYQLILDRKIGEYTLPDGWAIVAAGNRESDKGVVFVWLHLLQIDLFILIWK